MTDDELRELVKRHGATGKLVRAICAMNNTPPIANPWEGSSRRYWPAQIVSEALRDPHRVEHIDQPAIDRRSR